MFNYTNNTEYKGLWGLYTNAERNPLGHSPEASVRIDALARLCGSRRLLHLDADASLCVPPSLQLKNVIDACAYGDFCRRVDNEILLVDIQTSVSNTSGLNHYHGLIMGSGMAIDADELVMGKRHASRLRFVLFSPFGMTKWRLLCNMHENTVDAPVDMRALDIQPPRIELVHARLLRKTGLVAAPIRLEDLAGFPLRLLLRDWEQDVQELKDQAFMPDLCQWIETFVVRRSASPAERLKHDDDMAIFHLLYDEADADHHHYRDMLGVEGVFKHRWVVGPEEPGTDRLVIKTQLVAPDQSDPSDCVIARIGVCFTDAMLEALFSPIDTEGAHLTEDKQYPNDYALIGTVLSISIRVQALRHQLRVAIKETTEYTLAILVDNLTRVYGTEYGPGASTAKRDRLDRAEQAFRRVYHSMSVYYSDNEKRLSPYTL